MIPDDHAFISDFWVGMVHALIIVRHTFDAVVRGFPSHTRQTWEANLAIYRGPRPPPGPNPNLSPPSFKAIIFLTNTGILIGGIAVHRTS